MASMTLRDPILLAIQWASLDLLAEGRTIFGACLGGAGKSMGAGALETEIYGVPSAGRVRRFEEEIALLRRLWTEDNVTFEGEVYRLARVTAVPKPHPSPPPIWIATNPKRSAASERVIDGALERVARLGDGYMTDAITVDEFAWRWRRVREHAVAAGRDPAHGDVFDRSYLQTWVISGPADRVAARIRAYLEAGCTMPVLRFASPGRFEQLERVVADVMPQLLDSLAPVASGAPR